MKECGETVCVPISRYGEQPDASEFLLWIMSLFGLKNTMQREERVVPTGATWTLVNVKDSEVGPVWTAALPAVSIQAVLHSESLGERYSGYKQHKTITTVVSSSYLIVYFNRLRPNATFDNDRIGGAGKIIETGPRPVPILPGPGRISLRP